MFKLTNEPVDTISSLQIEESQIIKRNYPNKKQEKLYPLRYDKMVFEKLNEMKSDVELQNDYKKWKNGINYDTNRKIKIGGKIHKKLEKKFIIHSSRGIRFDILNDINVDEYLQETKIIYDNIDVENDVIIKYNSFVDDVIEKIKKIERWDEFIEFENKKYGFIDTTKNNIHIENNCFGEMFLTCEKKEYICNDRPFCNYDDKEITYLIYKCSRCNHEEKKFKSSIGGGSQYVSTAGFWWK